MLSVVTTIAVGSHPLDLAVSPSGSQLYVANVNSSDVSVVDTDAEATTSTIGIDSDPASVVLHPGGSVAYVARSGDGVISVIDASSQNDIADIEQQPRPRLLAIS